MMNGQPTSPSLGTVYERINEALEAVGAVIRVVGDHDSDALRHVITEDLNGATVALQAARGKVAGVIESGGAGLA